MQPCPSAGQPNAKPAPHPPSAWRPPAWRGRRWSSTTTSSTARPRPWSSRSCSSRRASPWSATLLSFASYGVAFVARPLGAAVFGHFGDKLGRKSILFITLLMMGLATFLIGCLPSYGQVGMLAPILLVVLRIIQGLALGGEWGGAAIMVNELDPEGKRRGLLGGGADRRADRPAAGQRRLRAVTWQVSEEAFLSWGWRVPFLMSAHPRGRGPLHPHERGGVQGLREGGQGP